MHQGPARDANNQMYPVAWAVVEKGQVIHGTGFLIY